MTSPADNFSGTGYQTSGASVGDKFSKISARAKEVILNPISVWPKIRDEETTIQNLYRDYIIPLAAIPAVCGFLGMWFLGLYKFFPGLVSAFVEYGFQLLFVYVGAWVVMQLAPKFEGKTDLTQSVKLMAYSMTPGYVLGVLLLFPILGVIGALLSLYGLYLFFQGVTPMTSVPESKRPVFFGVSIATIIVCMIILRVVFALVGPKPDLPIYTAGQGEVNFEQLEKGMKEFEKLLPKS